MFFLFVNKACYLCLNLNMLEKYTVISLCLRKGNVFKENIAAQSGSERFIKVRLILALSGSERFSSIYPQKHNFFNRIAQSVS